jgi:hypothetical protein
MNDREVMRLERIAKLFDEGRGADTRLRTLAPPDQTENAFDICS